MTDSSPQGMTANYHYAKAVELLALAEARPAQDAEAASRVIDNGGIAPDFNTDQVCGDLRQEAQVHATLASALHSGMLSTVLTNQAVDSLAVGIATTLGLDSTKLITDLQAARAKADESRYVRTPEELDALPNGTVIHASDHNACYQRIGGDWYEPGDDAREPSIPLPALVLWTPDKAVTE